LGPGETIDHFSSDMAPTEAEFMNRSSAQQPPQGVNRVMGIREWGLIAVLSILWGGSFFFVGVAVRELPPLTVVCCRVGLAAAILLVVVHLKEDRMPTAGGVWGGFFAMGAMNNVIPFTLIVWGMISNSISRPPDFGQAQSPFRIGCR
jgi:hypothetical protein